MNILAALFSIHSLSGTKTFTMKLTKKAAVKLSDHTLIAYLLNTSLASCNLENGFRRFVPQLYVTITNPQRQAGYGPGHKVYY